MNNIIQHRFYEVRYSKPIEGRYLPIVFIRTIIKKLLKYVRPPRSGYSDADLLNSIRRSDQQAFEAIFERYWATIFDFAFARVQSVHRSKEVVEDVFASLWLEREFLPAENLRSYLYAEANNRSLNYLAESFNNALEKKIPKKEAFDSNKSNHDSFYLKRIVADGGQLPINN
jgi:hypothetical protein